MAVRGVFAIAATLAPLALGKGPGMDLETLFVLHKECPAHTCPTGTVPVQKDPNLFPPFYYGCDERAYNLVLSMDGSADPNKPPQYHRRLQQCCAERDLCVQACGVPWKHCQKAYDACISRKCGADDAGKNCRVGGRAGSGVTDGEPEEKCLEFKTLQHAFCRCVPEAEETKHLAASVRSFYKEYDSAKLDLDVGTDDQFLSSTVFSKSFKRGEEGRMFHALFKKNRKKFYERPHSERIRHGQPAMPNFLHDYESEEGSAERDEL